MKKNSAIEITQKHTAEIEEIRSSMDCPKDFECYKSGFEVLCKIYIFKQGDVLECLEKDQLPCELGFPFGNGLFCKCPLRKYIAKNFGK